MQLLGWIDQHLELYFQIIDYYYWKFFFAVEELERLMMFNPPSY